MITLFPLRLSNYHDIREETDIISARKKPLIDLTSQAIIYFFLGKR